MKISNYFYTLIYLKPSQIYHRILRRFKHPVVHNCVGVKEHAVTNAWMTQCLYPPKLLTKVEVCFLNKKSTITMSSDWNDESRANKLWLYNLHYFDGLIAFDTEHRQELHIFWITRWINENPAPLGNGWEPYPTSLRIVNWVKAFLSGIEPSQLMLNSLSQQADYLSQNLEKHILGNHLFVNAKALIYAGLFFKGEQSKAWLKTGLAICDKELKEQVLADGGNFELSPMYHNIMLLDFLDLINIAQAYPRSINNLNLEKWRNAASCMLAWMNTMLHPDGEIAFFNDAAMGIAPSPKLLKNYAKKLNINTVSKGKSFYSANMLAYSLRNSGYIRVDADACVALLDCARVGPDYLPGHAHADTLSFEMSLYSQRVFVNSGTSCYGFDTERQRQRGTAAHNTVVVNGKNSSEVWSGFRVARRAYPTQSIIDINDGIAISCSHNGYQRLKKKVIHQRSWCFKSKCLHIVDKLEGEINEANVYFYLHPDVKVKQSNDEHSYTLTLISGEQITLNFDNAKIVELKKTTWHPEFGSSIDNNCLIATFNSNLMTTTIYW